MLPAEGCGEEGAIYAADGYAVAFASASRVTMNNNARLISAAPDLLSALEGLLADVEEYVRLNNLHAADGGPASNHAMAVARAAISKARGSR